ncbi:M48 family metalloprotease [Candidatus Woesearchaeota archaeon]|nr:M48 family metalloprotease [Candidatus Woesearchaeota archaeon]
MFWNKIKTVVLLGILSGFLLAIGMFLGGTVGLSIGLTIALLMNFVSYWASDKIALKIYRAKKASEKEEPELHSIVEDVCKESNCIKPPVYVIPNESPNAFACGRNEKHSAVAVTAGLLKILTRDELKGVIAHEIAHIKNKDILIQTVAGAIATSISYIALFARIGAMAGGFGGGRGRNAGELLAIAILTPLMAMLIQLAISRSREYLADETGAKNIKNSKALASALAKMSKSIDLHPMKKTGAKEATAHMFIANPFRGGLLNLLSTHPPMKKRIERLNSMQFEA